MLFFKIFVCSFYGLVSIAQTLNSRFLFKNLQFDFYSSVFLLQRIVILLINWRMGRKTLLPAKDLCFILPYAVIMGSINLLSSYCVTIMPLAAFMAFKKFVVFFVLVVGLCMSIPQNFTRVHYGCIAGIVLGGLMIGERDIFRGEVIGYISSLVYTLFEALSLQYSLHLYEKRGIGPQGTHREIQEDLMVANSIISLPYYFAFLLWQGEPERILRYCSQPTHPLLPFSLLFAIALSFASEYTANTISMRISPFGKASVSNIKDLVLTLISIYYFQDFIMTGFSEVGIFFCLSASIVFSCTLIEKSEIQAQQPPVIYQQIGQEIDHHNFEEVALRDGNND